MAAVNDSNNIMSSLIFCGVDRRCVGDDVLLTPDEAADAVQAVLGWRHKVHPAVCVYHTGWGCAKGGDPAGAYRSIGYPEEILLEADELRKSLKQSTLCVGLSGNGEPTVGFTALSHLPLREIAEDWQEVAAQVMHTKGVYVSCGMAEVGRVVVISAEANPQLVRYEEPWREAVKEICTKVGAEYLGFIKVGYNCLKDDE